jgi:hypothetical protein
MKQGLFEILGGKGSGNKGHGGGRGGPGNPGGSTPTKGKGSIGSSAKSKGSRTQVVRGLSKGEFTKYEQEMVAAWDPGKENSARVDLGLNALTDLADGDPGILVKKGSALKAIASLYKHDRRYLVAGHVATAEPGYGVRLMRDISNEAIKQGKGVKLFPTNEAIDFYLGLGMKYSDKTFSFFFTRSDCEKFIDKVEGKV